MYLITVEGGDGSGKGEAVRILRQVAADFPFPDIHLTHEPRRHSEIGALAMDAVRKGNRTPLEEAGLFAADRVDHSHTWIKPRLMKGDLVISDRNVHSSLVYQGIIGGLGVEAVAGMNRGALIPDLVVWVDCDPDVALKRISTGTLRSSSKEGEYFETSEIQLRLRAGYYSVLGKDSQVPAPFDKCIVAGPILNEGSKVELRKSLRAALRKFLTMRPPPQNVNPEEVDRQHLARMVKNMRKQRRLPGAPKEATALVEGWLSKKTPAQWMEDAEKAWEMKKARDADVTARPISHSCWSILGTLSFIDSTDIPRLRRKLGPVRSVTQRHTQRMIRWYEQIGFTHRQQAHVPFSDAPLFKIRDEWVGLGRLQLAMWPLMGEIAAWRRRNTSKNWDEALIDILKPIKVDSKKKSALELQAKIEAIFGRLDMLTSGHKDCPAPMSIEQLLAWWKTAIPE
ncbi:MAG TPA: dTMP kinase [Candidatus Poseidoniales archaeon]|nr:MAG: dTMP kinase [Euryarchaeota archaeon]HIG02891.1 dTMP kinase [Candidatus Poseidoniales archaeon]